MVAKEPIIRAITTLMVTLFVVDIGLHPLSFSVSDFFSIGCTVFVVSAISCALTWLYYQSHRDDQIAALKGETVRGMSTPIGKVPQQRPPLPTTDHVSDQWFAAVPEIFDAQTRDGLSPIAFWNRWCEHHQAKSEAHVDLAKTVLKTIAYRADFPAGHDPSYHGGRSLLAHSLLVAFYCHQEREKYQFTTADMRGVVGRDKNFSFDPHRNSPLILLMGLAHDIGKLLAYREKPGHPGSYEILSDEHDRMGIVVLSRMDAWWALPTADRDTLTAVIGHYHAESRMPVGIDNRAIDDLRHALVYLLIKADTKAGAAEASYTSIKSARASGGNPTQRAPVLATPAPTRTVQVAPHLPPAAPEAPLTPVVTTGAAPSTDAVKAQPAAKAATLDHAYDRLLDSERRIDEADSPLKIKAARYSHIRSVAAIGALTNTSPLIGMFCQLLFTEKSINSNGAIGYRVDDKQRGVQLLYVVEPTLRARMVALPECPAEHKSEYGRSNLKTLSPISIKLLSALKAKGWLWNPIARNAETANEHALYVAYLVKTKGDVFIDRANHVLTEAWQYPSATKPSEIPRLPAGFFVYLSDDPEIRQIAAVPEYEKLVVTGPSIFGRRGITREAAPPTVAAASVVGATSVVTNEPPTQAAHSDLDELLAGPLFNASVASVSVAAKPTQESCYSSPDVQQLEKFSMRLREALLMGEISLIPEATTSAALAFSLDRAREILGEAFNQAMNGLTERREGDALPIALGTHGNTPCVFLPERTNAIA